MGHWRAYRWPHWSHFCLGNIDKRCIPARTIYLYVWKCAADVCTDTFDICISPLFRLSSIWAERERNKAADKEFTICIFAVNTVVIGILLLARIWNYVFYFWTTKDVEYCFKYTFVV